MGELSSEEMARMNYADYFTCDPIAGKLIWKARERDSFTSQRSFGTWNARFAGKVAGNPCSSRGKPSSVQVRLKGKMIGAHRILWELCNGPIPEGLVIDHINVNPWDNRLSNLRLATHTQNHWNTGLMRDSKYGVKGVTPSPTTPGKPWSANIGVHGKLIYLGRFQTKGLAALAYAKAAMRYHGAFANVGKSLAA